MTTFIFRLSKNVCWFFFFDNWRWEYIKLFIYIYFFFKSQKVFDMKKNKSKQKSDTRALILFLLKKKMKVFRNWEKILGCWYFLHLFSRCFRDCSQFRIFYFWFIWLSRMKLHIVVGIGLTWFSFHFVLMDLIENFKK